MPHLQAFGFSGYRSFGQPTQYFAPLTKVNLLAGANNSGKSNVLTFAQRILGSVAGKASAQAQIPTLAGLDLPVGIPTSPLTFTLGIRLDDAIATIQDGGGLNPAAAQAVQAALGTKAMRLTGDDFVWIRYALERGDRATSRVSISADQMKEAFEELNASTRTGLQAASNQLAHEYGGRPGEDLRRVIQRKLDLVERLPKVETVSAYRQVRPGGDTFEGWSGSGTIVGLAQLQNPGAGNRKSRERFDAIAAFVRTVLEDDTAELEVPFERDTLLVHLTGRVLPLENLGTGIHQVIILAAACTILDNHLVCIEEPEIHLHPLLQRKLVTYLAAQTNNQYLIATHSAHMLDTAIASVFSVVARDDGSKVRRAATSRDVAEICAELGYRPSDLIQTNAILWVEGPSDRIYVVSWLRNRAPDLLEGTHFSIMFYGGRLLSHLSPNDPDVEDFISLRRLNRHVAILMDSDRASSSQRINDTKSRILDTFEGDGPGFAWVTTGYCIENYLPHRVVSQAIADLHPTVAWHWDAQRFHNPFRGLAVDKVAVARHVASRSDAYEDRFDLDERLKQLVDFIRQANG